MIIYLYSFMLPVSTMGGKVHLIDISEITNVTQLKRAIYELHPHIPKPFPIEEFYKLDIKIIHQGKTLVDTLLLSEITLGDECLYCMIKSRPLPIVNQVDRRYNYKDTNMITGAISAMENYVTSPLQTSSLPERPPITLTDDNIEPYVALEPTVPHFSLESDQDQDQDIFFDCQTDNPFTKLVVNKLLTRVEILEQNIRELRHELESINLH
jgi:hypothetical protein